MIRQEVKDNESISNSMNVNLHKNLILSGVAATFMPSLAFQYKFQEDALTAVDVTDTETLMHCLMYHDNLEDANHVLLETFILYLYDYFVYRFGPKVIGKRPHINAKN